MKKELIVLVLLLVFLFGCAGPKGQTIDEEAQAIKLADESAFGKYSNWYGDLLEGGKNCDFDQFSSIFEKKGYSYFTRAADSIKPYFDSAKQCLPSLEKKVEKMQDGKYRIIYSIESTSDCKKLVEEMIMTNELKVIHNQFVVVDLKTKEVEMPDMQGQSSSLWENAYEQLEKKIKQTEATYGEDAETMTNCSIVGDFAMFKIMIVKK